MDAPGSTAPLPDSSPVGGLPTESGGGVVGAGAGAGAGVPPAGAKRNAADAFADDAPPYVPSPSKFCRCRCRHTALTPTCLRRTTEPTKHARVTEASEPSATVDLLASPPAVSAGTPPGNHVDDSRGLSAESPQHDDDAGASPAAAAVPMEPSEEPAAAVSPEGPAAASAEAAAPSGEEEEVVEEEEGDKEWQPEEDEGDKDSEIEPADLVQAYCDTMGIKNFGFLCLARHSATLASRHDRVGAQHSPIAIAAACVYLVGQLSDGDSCRTYAAVAEASQLEPAAVRQAYTEIYPFRKQFMPAAGAVYKEIRSGGSASRTVKAEPPPSDYIFYAEEMRKKAMADQSVRAGYRGPYQHQEGYEKQSKLHMTSRNPDSASGFVGVSWVKLSQKWMARIKHDGTKHYLGLFDYEEDAARAFDDGARKLRGRAAHGGRSGTHWWRLNFPLPEEEQWAAAQGMIRPTNS